MNNKIIDISMKHKISSFLYGFLLTIMVMFLVTYIYQTGLLN